MRPAPASPAKGVLAVRRIPNRKIANTLGFSEHYVSRVLNGYQPPSARFRAQLAAFLDLPEDALFPPQVVS